MQNLKLISDTKILQAFEYQTEIFFLCKIQGELLLFSFNFMFRILKLHLTSFFSRKSPISDSLFVTFSKIFFSSKRLGGSDEENHHIQDSADISRLAHQKLINSQFPNQGLWILQAGQR